eukprot:Plantae.Rhodophyta-Hildenbrandia_rubra.ctg210.p1 GENE.Plantae.Rhodophyta-Hildenbrandia_rubra.ctg210~~Plantae.Rhodophyta-Hildenbrandia_rubra.ctg210.p1  ORF type:complete len:646 (+),score=79.24 Plantae.Rhodophyta-Hildenbrandia_rubra.ctg210:2113-4050(+)
MNRHPNSSLPFFMRRYRRRPLERCIPPQLPLLVLALFAFQTLAASFAFPATLFPGSSSRSPPPLTSTFADRSAYVELDKISGSAIAVADLDRDRFLDLVLLDTTTLNALSFALWDHQQYRFKKAGQRITLGEATDGEKGPTMAEEVLVADFNSDGTADLLVVGGGKGVVLLSVDGSPGHFVTTNATYVKGDIVSIVDAGRNLAPDIFVAGNDGPRGFYMNNGNGSFRYNEWKSAPTECLMTKINPPAFVDMDGDCLADLVIPSSCGIEIYTNITDVWTKRMKDAKLFGLEVFNSKDGDGPISFADFDASGSIDILVFNSDRNDILVHMSNRTYAGRSELCTADPYFNLTQVVGMARGVSMKNTYFGSLLFSKIHVPALIRTGDFDMDGYPDLLYVDSKSRPRILRNKRVWGGKSDTAKEHFQNLDDKEGRALRLATKGAKVVAATFWDTGESGQQDILLVGKSNHTRLITNGYGRSGDGMFFKGTLLLGPSKLGDTSARPFGPASGATFEVAYATRDSRTRRVRVCGQCPTSGWTLLPCNCLFGLGSISNYIEEVAVGSGKTSRSWANLMPNSMALVWANKEDASDGWRMEYSAQAKGAQILGVVSILSVVMILLGGVIIYLQNLETKRDREEGGERVQLIHFGG